MVNKKLVSFIQSEETKGFSDLQLKNFLKKKGFSVSEIDEAINATKMKTPSKKKALNPEKTVSSEPVNLDAGVSNVNVNFTPKKRPSFVSFLSIIDYIGSGIFLLFGLMVLVLGFIGKKMLDMLFSALELSANFGTMISNYYFVFILVCSVVLFALGIFLFFLAKDMRKLKPWTRYANIVIAALGVINVIFVAISGQYDFVSLILYGFLIWYFGFKKNVKEAFS